MRRTRIAALVGCHEQAQIRAFGIGPAEHETKRSRTCVDSGVRIAEAVDAVSGAPARDCLFPASNRRRNRVPVPPSFRTISSWPCQTRMPAPSKSAGSDCRKIVAMASAARRRRENQCGTSSSSWKNVVVQRWPAQSQFLHRAGRREIRQGVLRACRRLHSEDSRIDRARARSVRGRPDWRRDRPPHSSPLG